MGASSSQLEKQIGSDSFSANERYFGLANFGNTCYCNSVISGMLYSLKMLLFLKINLI